MLQAMDGDKVEWVVMFPSKYIIKSVRSRILTVVRFFLSRLVSKLECLRVTNLQNFSKM